MLNIELKYKDSLKSDAPNIFKKQTNIAVSNKLHNLILFSHNSVWNFIFLFLDVQLWKWWISKDLW